MSRILNHLYIGGLEEAINESWLRRHNIKYIINCAIEIPNYHKGIKYLNLGLIDKPSQKITNRLEAAYLFYQNAAKKGENVLVHCYAGVSRSAYIAIYIIMKVTGETWVHAFDYLKSRHPRTSPNIGFLKQLSRI